MARLLGPDANSRLAYTLIGNDIRSAAGKTATFYTNATGTTLADIATYNPLAPSTPGSSIAGSVLVIDAYSMIPLFWFPDSVDTVWVIVNGGPITSVNADYDPRLDALATAVATLSASVTSLTSSVASLTSSVSTLTTNVATLTTTVATINSTYETTTGAQTKATTAQTNAIAASVSKTGGGKEGYAANATATGAVTVDLANGNVHKLTLTGPVTLTLTGSTNATACAVSLYLLQDGTGTRLVTWPASVKWPSATAPTLSTGAGKLDLVILETVDGGTTWYGSLAGLDFR